MSQRLLLPRSPSAALLPPIPFPSSSSSAKPASFFIPFPSSSSKPLSISAAALPPSDNGPSIALAASTSILRDPSIEVDAVTEAELRENGFRSTRRTKVVCTIGPNTCSFEQLEALASGGMNVARINMCHGSREWHRGVIERVRRLNEEKGYAVAIMMDTEGSEIHMGDLGGAPSAKAEVQKGWIFVPRRALLC